jgi:hypothetical protein
VVKPKLDPWLTIRVRDLLDTTQAPGRAQWRVYAMLTGADINLHGFGRQAAFSLEDVRLNHNLTCIGVRADSVGQRLIALLAIADTTVETSRTPDAPADSVAAAWYAGSRTLPAGWMALYLPPVDAWDSQQFQAGRGLVAQDPIKWGWDWSAKRGIRGSYDDGNFYKKPAQWWESAHLSPIQYGQCDRYEMG